ncbi:MAG: glycosyltransferase, partial [Methanobacterium sp.]
NFRLLTYVISIFFNLIIVSRKYNFDILHAHSAIPTGLIGVIVAKILKKPIFITVHGMDVNNFMKNLPFRMLIQFSLNNSAQIITVSKDLAENIKSLHINHEKITILRNSVNIQQFKPIKNKNIRYKHGIGKEDILVLFVGYLDVFKGIFELVDSFNEIKQENIKLMIVGTGPKKYELKDRVHKLGLEKTVIFTGNLKPEEMHNYYQAADIFTLPSYTEGLPISILEAMSCGTPVIATNVGGIPEIIDDNINGFIIPPKNKKILKDKLNILIKDAKLREYFAKNSIIKIKREFNIDQKIDKLTALYYNKLNLKK